MEHVFYSDGTTKKIAWSIQTKDLIINQSREHPQIYMNKVSTVQSKYIALHVGLFWGIGTFVIKNEDSVIIKLDESSMYGHLESDKETHDEFIKKRTRFIKQLIVQRNLKVRYELISTKENIARKIM